MSYLLQKYKILHGSDTFLFLDRGYCWRGKETKSIGGSFYQMGILLPLLKALSIASSAPDLKKRELVLNISKQYSKLGW